MLNFCSFLLAKKEIQAVSVFLHLKVGLTYLQDETTACILFPYELQAGIWRIDLTMNQQLSFLEGKFMSDL